MKNYCLRFWRFQPPNFHWNFPNFSQDWPMRRSLNFSQNWLKYEIVKKLWNFYWKFGAETSKIADTIYETNFSTWSIPLIVEPSFFSMHSTEVPRYLNFSFTFLWKNWILFVKLLWDKNLWSRFLFLMEIRIGPLVNCVTWVYVCTCFHNFQFNGSLLIMLAVKT